MKFLPVGVDAGNGAVLPLLLRPQWLADGRGVVVAWPWVGSGGEASEDGLNLAILPVAGKEPVRLFQFPEVRDALALLLYPLPIAGSGLFLPDQETNAVMRIDLQTGTLSRLPGMRQLTLLPTGREDRLLYLGRNDLAEEMEIGWMRTDTGERTVLFTSAPLDLDPDEDFFAVSRDGRRFACLDRVDDEPVCRLQERGRPDQRLALGSGAAELVFGQAVFSPDGNTLFVSILAPTPENDGGPVGGLGFLELPVDGRPARRTILVQTTPTADYETAAYFQLGVSADGRALAVASTYYAYEDDLLTADTCALFLVDLTDPKRSATKVPVALPPRREPTQER
jgi:hypothetical protein